MNRRGFLGVLGAGLAAGAAITRLAESQLPRLPPDDAPAHWYQMIDGEVYAFREEDGDLYVRKLPRWKPA